MPPSRRVSLNGADEEAFLRVNHIVQALGILNQGGDIDHSSDVGAAMTGEDPNPDIFFRDIPFRWIDPFPGQSASPGPQERSDQSIGSAGGHHRFRDIDRPSEGATDEKHPWAGGFYGIDGIGFTESVSIELDAELFRQAARFGGRGQPDAQNHQVELVLLHALRVRRVSDGYVLCFRDLSPDRNIAPDERDPGEVSRPLVEAFEILAVGPNVIVEDGRLGIGVMVLCQNHLLLDIGAAHRAAIPSRTCLEPTQ